MQDLVQTAIVARGGLDRWNRVGRVSATAKFGGPALEQRAPAFTSQPTRVSVETHWQRTTFEPFMAPDLRSIFARDIVIEAIVVQIAAHLAREFMSLEEPVARGRLAPWRLRMIDERLAELAHPPTLSELAMLCRISVRQLTRGFQASRGVSIGRHATESRFEVAKNMLARGRSAKAVAYSLGFSSPSSFSASFRRHTGFSPKMFKS